MKARALLLLLLASCAGTETSNAPPVGGSKDTSRFPSEAELQALTQREKPDLKSARDIKDVTEWKLEGPLPEALSNEVAAATNAWEKELEAHAQKRPGVWVMGKDMQCTAKEIGRFWLTHQATPPRPLEDFIAGRCGSAGAHLQVSWVEGEPRGATDAKLFEAWRDSYVKQIEHYGATPRSIGVWYGKKNGKAVIMIASAERKASVVPMSLRPQNGKVVVEGELFHRYDRVAAHINKGDYGYGTCALDASVALPKFRFECEPDMADAAAWIDVSAWEPGRFLGWTVAGVLALPNGKADTYSAPKLDKAAKNLSTTAALLDRANVLRARAQLAPLVLEEKQSMVSAELAPYYFAAQFGDLDETISDKVALGVMAGWGVSVPIVDGDFTSVYAGHSKDPATLIAGMLARPHGRETLLKPGATRLAIGVLEADGASLGALVSSYVPSSTVALDKETDVFIDRVNAERKKRKKPEITAQTLVASEEAAYRDALASNRWTTRRALDELLKGRVSQTGTGLRGWELTGESTATMAIPNEVLDLDKLTLTIVVGKQKERKGPWERVVTILTIEGQR